MLNAIFYTIIFLLALIISNIINKVFPKVPLPMIQVVLGILLGLFGGGQILRVEPEVFLAFIIAPLLFRESEEADVVNTFKYTRIILVLIFPLVFITTLGIGFLTHFLYGTIPLAAAFALGGALAPTDAIAVGSLSERFGFPQAITSILQGEGLLNDASGLIAFQFALAALITGQFSLGNASVNLLLAAVGGAAVGALLVWLKNLLLTVLEDVAARDISGYLMLEFVMPLAAFLIADNLQVSGIIAVVVTGVLSANGIKRTTLFDAQISQVKSTIWETLIFILKAVVFLFLGIELDQLALPLIHVSIYSNSRLLLMAALLTLALFVIRFVTLALYFAIRSFRGKRSFGQGFNNLLLLTFAGSKGTVSIAAILLLPLSATKTQPLLVFLCTTVTVLTFLIGMLVLPFFAEKKAEKIDNMTRISILTDVVEELEKDMLKLEEEKRLGYILTVDNYQERIKTLIIEQESLSEDYNNLQLFIMQLENEGLEVALRDERITEETYRIYQRYLRSLEQTISHHLVSSLQFVFLLLLRLVNSLIFRLLHINFPFYHRQAFSKNLEQELIELYFGNTEIVLQALENLEDVYDSQLINYLQLDRLRAAKVVHSTGLRRATVDSNLSELMRGYYLERKLIFEYEQEGKLDKETARDLRQNVNVMEEYSMRDEGHSFLASFLTVRQRH